MHFEVLTTVHRGGMTSKYLLPILISNEAADKANNFHLHSKLKFFLREYVIFISICNYHIFIDNFGFRECRNYD